MASARHIAGTISGAFARGYGAARGYGRHPGWAGQVSPFEYGTVTPGAMALKSLASLIYGRRAAANADVAAEQGRANARYRDMQMQVLQQKLSNPTGAKPAPTTSISAGAAKDLIDAGLMPGTYDAQTGEVPQRDLAAAHAALIYRGLNQNRTDTQKRLTEASGSIEARRTSMTQAAATQQMLKQLDEGEKNAGEDRGIRAQQVIAKHLAVLNDPQADPAAKQASAAYLELPPVLDKTGKPLSVNGQPVYDTSSPGAQKILAGHIAQWKAFGAQQHRQANATQRAQLQSTYAKQLGAAGVVPGADANATPQSDQPSDGGPPIDDGNDPIMQAAKKFMQQYSAPQPAPATEDTTGQDIPAED